MYKCILPGFVFAVFWGFSCAAQTPAQSLENNVDPFTGDFKYNVPVANISGPHGESYPFTVSYTSGIKVDQDASWVGLGWTLEGGEITRKVNGMPDDFDGAPVVSETYHSNLYTASLGGVSAGKTTTTNYYGPLYYSDYPTSRPTTENIFHNMDVIADVNSDGNVTMMPAFDDFYISANGISGNMRLHLFDFARLVPSQTKADKDDVKFDDSEHFTHRPEFVCGDEYINSVIPLTDLYGGRVGCDYLAHTYTDDDNNMFYLRDEAYNLKTITGNSVHQFDNYLPETNRLKTKKYVKYYTNEELHGKDVSDLPGFLNFEPICSTCTVQRVSSAHPPKAIGAIEVIDETGFTYHFSLPVYTHNEVSKDFQLTDTYEIADDSLVVTTNNNRYAISWKLTAITGPDYVDANEDNIADEGDEGYWISFNYSKWGDIVDRFPAYGLAYNAGYKMDPQIECSYCYTNYSSFESKVSNYNRGFTSEKAQEVYYLETVRTSTQSLYFFKEVRKDLTKQKSALGTSGFPLLYLKRIALIDNNQEPDALISTSTSGLETEGTSTADVNVSGTLLDVQLTHSPQFLPKTLGSVQFNYDYSLAPKYFGNADVTLNTTQAAFVKSTCEHFEYVSFDDDLNFPSEDGQTGKLTLLSIQGYDLEGSRNKGSTEFEYNSSKNFHYPYQVSARDFWGYYKSDFSERENPSARYPTPASAINVDAWSLTKITLPSKAEITVSYESDRYDDELLIVKSNGPIDAIPKKDDTDFEDDLPYLLTQYGVSDARYEDDGQLQIFEAATTGGSGLTAFQKTSPFAIFKVDEMFGGGVRVSAINIHEHLKNVDYGLLFEYDKGKTPNTPYKYATKSNYIRNPAWAALGNLDPFNPTVGSEEAGVLMEYLIPKSAMNTGLNTFVAPVVGYGEVKVTEKGGEESGRLGYKKMIFENRAAPYGVWDAVQGIHLDVVSEEGTSCRPKVYPRYVQKVSVVRFPDNFGKVRQMSLYDNVNNLISTVKYNYSTRVINEAVQVVNEAKLNESRKYFYTYVNVSVPFDVDQYYIAQLASTTSISPTDEESQFEYYLRNAQNIVSGIASAINERINNPTGPGSQSPQQTHSAIMQAMNFLLKAASTSAPCPNASGNHYSTVDGWISRLNTFLLATVYDDQDQYDEIQDINNEIGAVLSSCFAPWTNGGVTPITGFSSTAVPVNISGWMMVPECSSYSGTYSTHNASYVVMEWQTSRLESVYTVENAMVKSDSTVYNDLGMANQTYNRVGDYITAKSMTYAYQNSSYSELGAKSLDPDNKNILLLKSSITDAPGYTETVNFANNMKRVVWNLSDGFETENNSLWTPTESFHAGKLKGGVNLYNAHNKPVETYDALHRFSSQKYGYKDKYIIATANQSMYSEFTHSSFEDDLYTGTTKTGLSGELYLASTGEVVNASSVTISGSVLKAHTGLKVARLTGSTPGIVYGGIIEHGFDPATDLDTYGKFLEGKSYVVSVWVHTSSGTSPDIKVYTKNIGGSGPTLIAQTPSEILTSASWKLYQLTFTVPDITTGSKEISIEVTKAGTSDMYIDDLRIQPVTASVQAYVYDNFSGLVNYTINENNMYTRNEYDKAGRVVKQFMETKNGEKLLKEYNYHVPF